MAEIYPEAFEVSVLRFDDPYEEESPTRRRRDDFPGEGWEKAAGLRRGKSHRNERQNGRQFFGSR